MFARTTRFIRIRPAEESISRGTKTIKGIKDNEVSDMKVGLIYTSTTPELIADVEREVKKQLGEDVEMFSLQDPSILADVRAAGYVTAAPRPTAWVWRPQVSRSKRASSRRMRRWRPACPASMPSATARAS